MHLFLLHRLSSSCSVKEHVDFVSPLAHYPLLPYCNNDFGNSPKTLDHLRVHSACIDMIVDGCGRVHVIVVWSGSLYPSIPLSPSVPLPPPTPSFFLHTRHRTGYEWSPANALQGREGSTGGIAQSRWYPPLSGRNCHTDQTSHGQGY